jgi:hypothetical protein
MDTHQQADSSRFRSSIEDLRGRLRRARLLAVPMIVVVWAYLGLLLGYWSGLVTLEWAGGAALVLFALFFVSGIPALVGLSLVADWRCPACGASALPAGYLWWNRPLRWRMFLPLPRRGCLACGASFTDEGKTPV